MKLQKCQYQVNSFIIYSNISSHTPLLLSYLIIHWDSAARFKLIWVKCVSWHTHLCNSLIAWVQFNHWCPDCLLTDRCYHFSFRTMVNGWYILSSTVNSALRLFHTVLRFGPFCPITDVKMGFCPSTRQCDIHLLCSSFFFLGFLSSLWSSSPPDV